MLMLLSLASGCTTMMSAQVTSFHRTGQTWAGKTFLIVPDDKQRGNLEFDAYARQIVSALAAHGLVPMNVGAASGSTAQLRVHLEYGVDEPRAVTYEQPVYGYANFGPVWSWQPYYGRGGAVYHAWGPTYPLAYGVIGSSPGQYRVWRHRLDVRILEASPDAPMVFEGKASTQARTDSLPTMMPVLVEALLRDFPGLNGQSRSVDVEVRERDPDATPDAQPRSEAPPRAAPQASPQSTRSQ